MGVEEVRGKGLLIGIVLEGPRAKNIVLALENEGVLANAANDFVVRIAPPLIITMKEAERFVAALRTVMAQDR